MTTEHPNVDLMRRLFNAFKDADLATIQSIIAADAVWRFPGVRGSLAGEYHGLQEITHFLTSVSKLTNGTFHVETKDITASDDHAVILFTGLAERRGKTLQNPTALVVSIHDGKARDFREFVWDLPTVEDFWS